MTYIIGVDCGGTSTKAVAYTMDGLLLHESETSFGNVLIDQNKALKNIRQCIEKIMFKIKNEVCQAIILGIAGVDSGNFFSTVRKYLSSLPTKEIIILNDAWLAHAALLKGEDGCLTIAGTGSITIGKYNGFDNRVGGWGHLLGDEGSGYFIAIKLIKSVLDATDAGYAFTSFQQKVLDFKPFTDLFDLVKFVYSSKKGEVARLAEIASGAADNGEIEAIRILEEAGRVLGDQTIQCMNNLEMKGEVNAAVSGSVLLKNDWVYQSFDSRIKQTYPQCRLIRKSVSNTIGGYYYYKKKMNRDRR